VEPVCRNLAAGISAIFFLESYLSTTLGSHHLSQGEPSNSRAQGGPCSSE